MQTRFPQIRTTLAKTQSRASSSSSQVWLSRQSRDPYVKQRSQDAYRSRSAYKLLELDDKYRFLGKSRVVVDLGAAPGGWSEAAVRRMRVRTTAKPPAETDAKTDTAPQRGVVIAVDLLDIAPIPGVVSLKGSFLAPTMHERVKDILDGRPVDVVLSDMCENFSGSRDRDAENALQLCYAAFSFASKHLTSPAFIQNTKRGTLIMKYFDHPDLDKFRHKLSTYFHRVETFKPKSSRSDSSEAYLVCIGWKNL